ncbi:MAG: hypothetical protein HKO75_00655 [Flavobacteriaceae bacterium]|nr:hypothetical protein [Muriicola sp.]NNL38346.1 hypothetical protein [Flavobacteriaceae bacterium]
MTLQKYIRTVLSLIRKVIFLVILLSLTGLKVDKAYSQDTSSKKVTFQLQQTWLKTLRKQPESQLPFTEISGLIVDKTLHIGKSSIKAAWNELNRSDQLIKYDTLAYFQLYPGQMFVHGVYTTDKGRAFHSIIGWKKSESWVKVFEATAPKSDVSENSKTEIGLLRSSWELYSNQHRPDLIARNVFSANGRYFYRGVEYRGMDIAEAYGYMRDKSYSIDLTPQKVIQVNDQLVYEIGVYDTGGKGLYFLLWAREGEEWKLLLDFNF